MATGNTSQYLVPIRKIYAIPLLVKEKYWFVFEVSYMQTKIDTNQIQNFSYFFTHS